MGKVTKEKEREYNQRSYYKNRENILAKCKENWKLPTFKAKKLAYKQRTKLHRNEQRRLYYKEHSLEILSRTESYKDIGLIRYWRLKGYNKRNKFQTTWEQNDFIDWFKESEKVCFYCKCQLIMFSQSEWNSYTLDRLDSNKGYNKDNVVFACRRCNTVKSKWLTSNQMLEIASKYFKNKGVSI